MSRRDWILVAALVVLAGSVTVAVKVRQRTAHAPRGSYLYFDAADRPLNYGKNGAPRPLSKGDSALVASRSFITFGEGGSIERLRAGAMCSLQEPCNPNALTATGAQHVILASGSSPVRR